MLREMIDRWTSRWQPKGGLEKISLAELGHPHARVRNPIVQGYLEGITQPLYDSYLVASSTALPKLILFSVPQGQIYNFGGITAFAKTSLFTNMVQNAVLPAPNKFIVRAISVWIAQNINPLDLNAMLNTVLLSFSVNAKDYCDQIVGRFPAGGGTFGIFQYTQATAADAAYSLVGNGWPDARNTYTQAYGGVPIEQQQTFAVVLDPTLNNVAAYTTKSSTASGTNEIVGTGVTAYVFLDGTLFRAVQ